MGEEQHQRGAELEGARWRRRWVHDFPRGASGLPRPTDAVEGPEKAGPKGPTGCSALPPVPFSPCTYVLDVLCLLYAFLQAVCHIQLEIFCMHKMVLKLTSYLRTTYTAIDLVLSRFLCLFST